MKWRRGDYVAGTNVPGPLGVKLGFRQGLISDCGTFGIAKLYRMWSLDLLTIDGRRIAGVETMKEAKALAEELSVAREGVDKTDLEAVHTAIKPVMRERVARISG